MWYEKGDFGSLFTNPFNLKNSNLEMSIKVEKKQKDSSEWIGVTSINIPKISEDQLSKVEDIDKDGYYTFEYVINSEKLTGAIDEIKYNDEIRITMETKFTSLKSGCTIDIDYANLDVTYQPDA